MELDKYGKYMREDGIDTQNYVNNIDPQLKYLSRVKVWIN